MSDQVDHAREQLDEAIGLFLEGQFAPALRRAGAADEILCKALSDSGKQNFLDWKYEEFEPFYTILHRKPLSKEDFIRDENRGLDAVTQMASEGDSSDTLDLEDAACSMIERAYANYDRLGLSRTARMLEFDNYFYEHAVGV
jgi:hypothetical protein